VLRDGGNTGFTINRSYPRALKERREALKERREE